MYMDIVDSKPVAHSKDEDLIAEREGLLRVSHYLTAVAESFKVDNAALLAERDQLREGNRLLGARLEQLASEMAELAGENERLRELLRQVVSPTQCYCVTLKDGKCWQCQARGALSVQAEV